MISLRRHKAALRSMENRYEATIERLGLELASLRRDNKILDRRLVDVLELLDAMPDNATTISIRRVRETAAFGTDRAVLMLRVKAVTK